MFAVIKTGGKQYKVAKDDVLKVERLSAEAGQTVALDEVLMVGGEDGQAPHLGAPLVKDASVTAEVLEQARAPKIQVFKKKRRKGYRRTHGHRQDVTVLRVTDIKISGASVGTSAEPAQKKSTAKKGAKEAAEAAAGAEGAGAEDGGAKAARKKSAGASDKNQGEVTKADSTSSKNDTSSESE